MNKLEGYPVNDTDFSRKTVVEIDEGGKLVKHSGTVKAGKNDPVFYRLDMVFNFSECSMKQILALAASTVWIKVQDQWRKSGDKLDAELWSEGKEINVRELYIRQAPSQLTDAEKAEKFALKLSPEERAALLEKLMSDGE
jgi:hypothetical protein